MPGDLRPGGKTHDSGKTTDGMANTATASAKGAPSINTIVMAGGLILALSFGARSMFGGIVEPISNDLFGGAIEIISLSIAIQNLVWGLAQPVFGMVADRYGDRRALAIGLCCYLAGLGVCIVGTTPLAQHLGAGLLVGMGISGTAFGVVLAVIGRAAPEEKRALYLGIASALGSVGQVVMPLMASWLTAWLDWRMTLAVITVMLAPMALCIPRLRADAGPSAGGGMGRAGGDDTPPLRQTVTQAFRHPSFLFLTAGFFVCGFHLAFITAHLPNYVQNFCIGTGMSPGELRAFGLRALSVVGFANIIGTLLATHLGTLFPKPYVLAAIYALRTLVILVFISQPLTPLSIMVFAFAMGVLWLSTVPLTSALVLTMFGPRPMGTLFGFVFLGHQLGGFIGVWLAGAWFDIYANYDVVWHASVALGAVSALLHSLVKERGAGPALHHA
ncbi:nitrate/nitrite transporter NarK [Eilatimonas milleporae]|uniref:Nitrate/nitrite transporter NarK n=2 Tax=Eilatimonas milleporae TaxID=911205 RepID=A0A3M0CE82_9PROT|nr:nitrate/nitrite transporter NarK [Eilatimonas milleporae]